MKIVQISRSVFKQKLVCYHTLIFLASCMVYNIENNYNKYHDLTAYTIKYTQDSFPRRTHPSRQAPKTLHTHYTSYCNYLYQQLRKKRSLANHHTSHYHSPVLNLLGKDKIRIPLPIFSNVVIGPRHPWYMVYSDDKHPNVWWYQTLRY